MAYDSESQKTILFGGAGLDLDHPYDDTWTYDYIANKWTNMDAKNDQTQGKNDQIKGFDPIVSLLAFLVIIIANYKRKFND